MFGEQRVYILNLLVCIEIAVAKDQIAARGAGGILRSPRHFGEEGIADVADDQREGI